MNIYQPISVEEALCFLLQNKVNIEMTLDKQGNLCYNLCSNAHYRMYLYKDGTLILQRNKQSDRVVKVECIADYLKAFKTAIIGKGVGHYYWFKLCFEYNILKAEDIDYD